MGPVHYLCYEFKGSLRRRCGVCLQSRVAREVPAHAFAEYWFETGTPTFLIDMLERVPEHIDGITLESAAFSVYEPSTPSLLPLLYQTGYLTITGSRREDVYTYYTLGFPDDEVRNAFSRAVSERFSHLEVSEHASLLTQMVEALRHDDVSDMLDALSRFFANIPGMRTRRSASLPGRADLCVGRKSNNPTISLAAEALAQIKEKGYAEKYLRESKKVTLVGAAFDAEMRNLADRQIEVAG